MFNQTILLAGGAGSIGSYFLDRIKRDNTFGAGTVANKIYALLKNPQQCVHFYERKQIHDSQPKSSK